jgi:hypothetical protein
MNIKVNYQGDLGDGTVNLNISNDMTIAEIFSQFHVEIGKSDNYQIGAGAPPFRRQISVNYEYRFLINGRRFNDYKQKISEIQINENDNFLIIVGGGGKVD